MDTGNTSENGVAQREEPPQQVNKKTITDEGKTVPLESDIFLNQIIGNKLIFDTLEKMLGFQDLKNCRRVSKVFNNAVVSGREFPKKTRLVVSRQTIESGILQTLPLVPKSVEVHRFLALDSMSENSPDSTEAGHKPRLSYFGMPVWSPEELEPVYRICEQVDEVNIYECDRSPEEGAPLDRIRLYPSLAGLLRKEEGVGVLRFMYNQQFCKFRKEFFNPFAARQNANRFDNCDLARPMKVHKLELHGPESCNLDCLPQLMVLDGVKVSDSRTSVSISDDPLTVFGDFAAYLGMVLMLENNCETLKELDFSSWANAGSVLTIHGFWSSKFPSLTVLKLPLESEDDISDYIAPFLQIHLPQLTELLICFVDGLDFLPPYFYIPRTVPPALVLQVLRNADPQQLKILTLRNCSSWPSGTSDVFDLTTCASLEQLTLSFREVATPPNFVDVLCKLPPSLQKLTWGTSALVKKMMRQRKYRTGSLCNLPKLKHLELGDREGKMQGKSKELGFLRAMVPALKHITFRGVGLSDSNEIELVTEYLDL